MQRSSSIAALSIATTPPHSMQVPSSSCSQSCGADTHNCAQNHYRNQPVTARERGDPELWTAPKKELNKFVLADLITEMQGKERPVEFLQRQDLSMLDSFEVDQVTRLAYRTQLDTLERGLNSSGAGQDFLQRVRDPWIDETDYGRLRSVAERLVKAEQRASELSGLAERNVAEGLRLAQESATLEALQRKVLRQLDIIEELFHDPTSVSRVEDYDNPFASGNFSMLQELAARLTADR